MMNNFFRGTMLLAVLFALTFFTGCPTPGTSGPEDNADALINSVWFGETPRDGDWLTIAFKGEGKVIWSFSSDNTSNEWDYTFDTDNAGTVISEAWNPCPNGFTINGDTLTVTNYGSHSGPARNFTRVRSSDLTITDPVPFKLETLTDDLRGSVWAGATPQGEDAWLTITFNAEGKVIWAFTFDNTTNEWDYTFDKENKKGTVSSSGWNPCPNGFTIDGDTLTVTTYGGHSAAPRSFKRYR
jgi:outer membrane protein assembly factor BamE (lipoprotein component of BamABCDE complex)